MAQVIELPWGADSLTIPLPKTWKVLGELLPKKTPAPKNTAAACTESLRDPFGLQALADRDLSEAKIVIIADDHSRPTPVRDFVQPVLKELKAGGAKDDRIEFLLANGVHRESRIDEVERKLGKDILSRFRWRCHNAYDRENLASLGATSRGTKVFINKLLLQADLIVCLGAIEPHLLLGFGGGLKMIVPGCAGAETIGNNHLQGVDPDHFDFVGATAEDSPMRLDLEEAAGLLDKEIFIVNATMNEEGRPTRFFSGDPIAAHRAGTDFLQESVEVSVPEPADVVVANSFPMDADLRQSIKCVGNSLYASKPGGVMLGCVLCENGLGEIPVPKKTLPYPILRTLVRLIGKNRVLPLVKKAKKDEPIEEVFIGHFGLQMLRRNHLGLFSRNLPEDTGKKMGMARTFTDIQAMINWAEAKTRPNATVWVFPYGGATFASRNP